MKRMWIGALILTLAGCSKEAEKEAEPVVPVQVAEVSRGPIERIVTGDGILRALDQSAIMPKISAPVTKFYVNRGDHVTKGQLLAELENRDLTANVADTKGAYEQAAAAYRNVSAGTVPDEVVKAEQDLEAAKEQLDASQKLLESRQQLQREGALARRQVDEATVANAQAKSQYETARKHLDSVHGVNRVEEVNSAQAQVASAKGKYDAAEAQLSYSEIHSPIDGVVADRAIFAGEMAAAGSPLMTIVDVSSVIARINIPQAQAAYVKVGQGARITSADTSVEVPGKVTVVSPAIDPNGTTVEVWIQAANPGERLRPGGTVRATIMAGVIPDAIVVPAAAVLPASDGGVSVMAVGTDNVAHEHKVEIGVRTPETAQILKGAQPGEHVVVEGGVGLQDGAKVRIGKPGEDKGGDDKGKPADKADKDDEKADKK
jgi:HlyD family secretion protein